jgi:hypothetical protein
MHLRRTQCTPTTGAAPHLLQLLCLLQHLQPIEAGVGGCMCGLQGGVLGLQLPRTRLQVLHLLLNVCVLSGSVAVRLLLLLLLLPTQLRVCHQCMLLRSRCLLDAAACAAPRLQLLQRSAALLLRSCRRHTVFAVCCDLSSCCWLRGRAHLRSYLRTHACLGCGVLCRGGAGVAAPVGGVCQRRHRCCLGRQLQGTLALQLLLLLLVRLSLVPGACCYAVTAAGLAAAGRAASGVAPRCCRWGVHHPLPLRPCLRRCPVWLLHGCLLGCEGVKLLHELLYVQLVVLQLLVHGLQPLLPHPAVILACRLRRNATPTRRAAHSSTQQHTAAHSSTQQHVQACCVEKHCMHPLRGRAHAHSPNHPLRSGGGKHGACRDTTPTTRVLSPAAARTRSCLHSRFFST